MSRAESRRRYEDKYPDRVNASKKKWLSENPDKRKESVKKYKEANKHKARQYILDNYEWYLWSSAKRRAKKYNIPFSLNIEDINIPEVCPYLGSTITRIQGEGRKDTNPSVDRVDSSKGYTKDNIEIISDLANRMKNSANKEQLVAFAKEVLKRYE